MAARASLGVAGVAAAMTGCGSHPASVRGSLRLAYVGSLAQLDPARAMTSAQAFACSLLFSGLMKFSPDLHVVPDLAVSPPTITSGGRVYTFTLRQDARFADSRPVTARDVAWSLSRALSPATQSRSARWVLSNIAGAHAVERGRSSRLPGVVAVNALTVQIRLRVPDSTFVQKLALPAAAVVEPHHALLRAGAGPWALARAHGNTLTFVPRRHYFAGPLQLRSLTLVPVRDNAEALSLYKHGSVDLAPVSFADWNALSSRDDFHQADGLDAYYAIPPRRESRSLATTLDRQSLINAASPALAPLTGLVPSAVPDYVSSSQSVDGPILTRPVRLVAGVSGPAMRALARALQKQWLASADGPRVTLIRIHRTLPDPYSWLRALSPYIRSSWYRSQLHHAVRLATDPVGRMNDYSSVESWALSTGAVIPLAQASVAYLVRPTVANLEVTPLGPVPANDSWAGVSVQ